MFAVIQSWFQSTAWSKDVENAATNEDLLRIIGDCSRRTAIVATHILCDNGKQGTCNVFRLIKRFAEKGLDVKPMRRELKSVQGLIQKIRLLRNSNDAHLTEREDWKKGFGELKARDVNRLLSVLFSVIRDCGKVLNEDAMPYDQLYKATLANSERLIRALREQVQAGKVGVKLMSVREWHERAHQEEFFEQEDSESD
jgi:hypothetical protein